MPLFRSHSNGNTASRRPDLDRQIGCIAGFFQIFDPQVRAKQIAGPLTETVQVAAAPHLSPPAAYDAESCTLPIPDVKEDSDFELGSQCVVGKVLSKGYDDIALSEVCIGDGALQGSASIQSTNDTNHDSICGANLNQQEKSLKPSSKAAPAFAREESAVASTMVRHRSFKDSEYHDSDVAFSPRRGNVAAYAAGGRRFMPNGSMLSTSMENRQKPKEDENWRYWSLPASHWPTFDSMHEQEQQEQEHDGAKSMWLSKGRRTAERHWAAEDSLEEWKQSLRALARLKEDEEAEFFRNDNGLVAPKASPRALRNELPPTSPARASAFDFKEAIRWSQHASSHAETPARRSWDDRDLPRSIAELREAINVRSRAISAPSPPPSPRPPSVVARLMGLDNLPQEQAPPVSTIERKPSGEAKLLQQLLQCSPSSPYPPLPPSSSLRAQQRKAGARNVVDYPALASPSREASTRSELQSMLKHVETLSLHGKSHTAGNAKPLGSMSRGSKPLENVGAEPRSKQAPPTLKKSNHQNYLPVVVLKQSEEIRSPSPRPSHGYQDEIERRLRQLGLQSSEQERKTLKQILEAMQHKGLLKPPAGVKSKDGMRRHRALSPGSSLAYSGHTSPAHTSLDGGGNFWPSPTVTKPVAHANVTTPRVTKRDESASIVIMRPLAKSASRVAGNTDNRPLDKERAALSSSRSEKLPPRKPRNAVKTDNTTAKESERSGQSRSYPLSASQLIPASLHTPAQTRKLSLKVRHGHVHVAKGSFRTFSLEQGPKSNSNLPTSRRRNREQAALSKDRAKPGSTDENQMGDAAVYGDITDLCSSDDMQNTSVPSECPSDGSLDDPVMQEMAMDDETGIVTPPREYKIGHDFGEIEGCFVKEAEQCSPVSVLDAAHISSDEVVDSPDEFEEDGGLGDFQMNGCKPLSEEVQFPLMIAQPVASEMLRETSISKTMEMDGVEDHACNVELSDANEHNLLEPPRKMTCTMPTIVLEEGLLQNGSDHACCNDVKAAPGQKSNEALSASEEYMQVATWRNDSGDWLHLNGDGNTHSDDACATDIEENEDMCARVTNDDASNEEMQHDAYGSMMDDSWISNVDLCYTEDVLRGAGVVVVGLGAGRCMADGWLAGGGKMGPGVYEELEEQWDALEDEGGCIEDRDMGGELYRKGQQASMRRRLLFDCVNEILEERFSWVGMPGASGSHRQLSVEAVWRDLQRLEEGPCSAEDSMYAMLEQDLLHGADYSIPRCWNGMPTQLASVALHLEHCILESLVLEVLPNALHW